MNKYLKIIFLFPATFLVSSCCLINKDGKFYPQQISCEDISSPDLIEVVEKFKGNFRKEVLYEPQDEIYYAARDLANQGNARSIYIYGSWRHDIVRKKFSYNNYESYIGKFLPDEYREDMVVALTYLYISSFLATKLDERDKEWIFSIINRIEKNDFDSKTPIEWIEEAKENANKWQLYCKNN